MNCNASLQLGLECFAASTSPAILIRAPVMPIADIGLQEFDRMHRKVMRRIVGWRRMDDEPWSDTMTCMNLRLAHGQALLDCQPWSMMFA